MFDQITNVYQEVYENDVSIFFTIDSLPYWMSVRKIDNGYTPITVRHDAGGRCTLCSRQDKWDICRPLEDQLNELFVQLIEHPSIRLEWLYLPYQNSKEGEK